MFQLPSSSDSIGILNLWWTCNYGGILTAYALQQAVHNLGYRSELINSRFLTEYPSYYDERVFEQFANDMLQTTAPICKLKDINDLNNRFSTFLVGSDQVWRHEYTHTITAFHYFCNFAYPGKKLIAMAASLGQPYSDYPESMRSVIGAYLDRFDAISVREQCGVDLLKREFNASAQHVIDPVFLHDAAWWSQLADRCTSQLPKKFTALCFLDEAEALSSHIKSISPQTVIYDFKDTSKEQVSVYEWVKAIRDAEFLVTDSFHAMCFAMIFKTPFLVLANKERGIARFENFLKSCALDQFLVFDKSDITLEKIQSVRYPHSYDAHLSPFILSAKQFLKDILASDCKNNRITYESLMMYQDRVMMSRLRDKVLKLNILKYRIFIALSWGKRREAYKKILKRIYFTYKEL